MGLTSGGLKQPMLDRGTTNQGLGNIHPGVHRRHDRPSLSLRTCLSSDPSDIAVSTDRHLEEGDPHWTERRPAAPVPEIWHGGQRGQGERPGRHRPRQAIQARPPLEGRNVDFDSIHESAPTTLW